MALLDIVQDAALELGLRNITSVVGSSDLLIRQLKALAEEEVKNLVDEHPWVQLQKEVTITLVDGQANYALPDDFDQHIFTTHWDRMNHWELWGPVSPQEWQGFKSGVSELTPRKVFRLKGAQDRKLYIHPTPNADDAGNTLVFEYLSRQVVRPATWVTMTSYVAGSYAFYDGNIYYSASGGTSGATPPTHTSSTASDGGVTWAFYDEPYEEFLKDTDQCVLPERIVKLGLKWRFRAAKRLDYEEEYRQYKKALSAAHAKISGAREISLVGRESALRLGDLRNVPDTGFGV